MKAILLSEILLLSSLAFAGNRLAWCELAKDSKGTTSEQGLPQIGNLGQIDIECTVPARPFPTKPGEMQLAVQVRTTVYQLLGAGDRRAVASDVILHGGGRHYLRTPPTESVDFYAYIPPDPSERDEEALKILKWGEAGVAPEQLTDQQRRDAIETARYMVDHTQYRLGHFQIECSVVDGTDVLGVGMVELIIVYEGRLSETFPFNTPPPSSY